jgi:K+-transporting ATPase ATPase A chain
VTVWGWIQAALFAAFIVALTPVVGRFLFRVYETNAQPLPRILGPVERLWYRLCGVHARNEQTWGQYTIALLVFSVFGLLVSYALLRAQHALPLNPRGFEGVPPALAFNTAVSFTTNTNWQSYTGEAVMSYLSQMAALAWHNFTSAAVGIGAALALARGITRRKGPDGPKTVGNFWVDLTRGVLYVLLPASILAALLLVSQGVLQNFAPYREVTTLEGIKQIIPMGPVASQEAIKQLGTNGGGFFNANSAHPFENPSPFTNFVEMLLIFVIPAGLTSTYGRMAGNRKQGWALFAAMFVLFLGGFAAAYAAEAAGNPLVTAAGCSQPLGSMEGKETRFGVAASTLFATVTTDASCGAVNAMHDSFTPLGGMVPMVNIALGEVIFGGVGAGLYGMLVFVLLSVFIAGLMVGRTPELLGKKIEAREMKLAMLYVLIFPLIILSGSAWAAVAPYGVSSLNNNGPHGLSEILYAFISSAGNNGSAFAGLNANTAFWNIVLAFVMLAGRFLMIIPALGIAGSLVAKRVVPAGPGTFPTDGPLFTALLVGVVLIVGALTFFPAFCLGPLVEHFLAGAGKVY